MRFLWVGLALVLAACNEKPVPVEPAIEKPIIVEKPKEIVAPAPVPVPSSNTGGGIVPAACRMYKMLVVAEGRRLWGVGTAPIATFGGQMFQESGCRKDAHSKYASGLAQFTPDTEVWIGGMFKSELAQPNALDPTWSVKALVMYDQYLYKQWPQYSNHCKKMRLALQQYNAGPGWIKKEDKAGRCLRKPEFCAETEGYHTKIMGKWEPMFATWGPMSCN